MDAATQQQLIGVVIEFAGKRWWVGCLVRRVLNRCIPAGSTIATIGLNGQKWVQMNAKDSGEGWFNWKWLAALSVYVPLAQPASQFASF
jgi:hypothetical protein